MRILAISDEECAAFWDYYTPGKLKEYDLILSSGDLKASYLSFLVTMARCPLLYVHGNHDTDYKYRPPEGCDCIDDRVVTYNGLRILGLGGCLWYRPGDHQYTEKEMEKRIRKLRFQIWKAGGVDIVVTHAPVSGWGDLEDLPHRGFKCFDKFVRAVRPRILVHGHVHMTYGHFVREREHESGTRLLNAYEYCYFDI